MNVTRSTNWEELTSESDASRQWSQAREITGRVDDSDVVELMTLVNSRDKNQVDPALKVLVSIQRQRPQLLSRHRESWTAALRQLLEKWYPSDETGKLALRALWKHDSSELQSFLLVDLQLDGLEDQQRSAMIEDFVFLGESPAVADRLREVAGLGGEAGQVARKELAARGETSREAVEELAAAWRRQKTTEALSAIYNACIIHLPQGTPMSEIIDLMGPPTLELDSGVWYITPHATLFLEPDDDEKLVARRFVS